MTMRRTKPDLEFIVTSELEPPYRVLVHNDDVTPMDFVDTLSRKMLLLTHVRDSVSVVAVLQLIFELPSDRALYRRCGGRDLCAQRRRAANPSSAPTGAPRKLSAQIYDGTRVEPAAPGKGAGDEMLTITNTHLLFHEFDYFAPRTVDEVLSWLAQYGDSARVMAGGTDLLVQMKMERRQPSRVISLQRIPELKHIRPNGRFENGDSESDGVEIGATTSIRSIYKSPILNRRYTALVEACNWFSTVQIMYMATLGGNLCNASPAADSAPPLLVFDAQVEIASLTYTRRVPLVEFFVAPGKTILRPDELLVNIFVPPLPQPSGSAFIKIGRVVADISKVCAAVRLTRDGKWIREARIALGAVAPTPMRARRAEATLVGQPFSPELAEHAAQIAAEESKPIDDVRSTRAYRRRVAAVIVRDALQRAWERSTSTDASPMRTGD